MLNDKSRKGLLKSFFSYTIPCMIGMFLTSFITIVDGLFIGNKLGSNGLAAVNLTLPVLYLFLGVSIMVGVGGLTLSTHSMGAKDIHRARKRFTLTLVINAAVILLLVILLCIFLGNVVDLLDTKGDLHGYVKDYLGTISYFYIFMMMNLVFSMFIRGEGRPQFSLLFGIAGNLINILLDYIFINHLNWGMKGAALASGIAVLIPFLMGCIYFLSGKSAYRFVPFKFDRADVKSILYNGSSEFIGQISIAITTYLFNRVIMKRIGIDGVAAFTIIGYISFLQSMFLTGVAQGINTLVSYSFGSKDGHTIKRLMAIGIKAAAGIGLIAFIVSVAASEGIVRLFGTDQTSIVEIAGVGMRIFAVSFLLNGYNIIASSYFTSLGDARTSAIISILRSLVLISVFIFVLPLIWGDTGIWLTVPLTELLTFVFSFISVSKSDSQLSFSEEPQATALN